MSFIATLSGPDPASRRRGVFLALGGLCFPAELWREASEDARGVCSVKRDFKTFQEQEAGNAPADYRLPREYKMDVPALFPAAVKYKLQLA